MRPVVTDGGEAPAPNRRSNVVGRLVFFAIAAACFLFLYYRLNGAAVREGLPLFDYMRRVFANVRWLPWLFLMVAYSCVYLAIDTLEKALTGRKYLAADHFTAADLFVGANVNFMLAFNLLDPRPVFTDYAARMTDRDAYRRAKEIDGKLIAEMQAAQPAQPQPA